MKEEQYEYDLFISHASEDKVEFVRPLVKKLREVGIKVWYDEIAMNVGDSLRTSIDHGLRSSKYAIAVFSKSYFEKKWTNFELNGYFSFDNIETRKILPIWHKVTIEEIREYSPMIADIVALDSNQGLSIIVEKIASVLGISSKQESVGLTIKNSIAYDIATENQILDVIGLENNIYGLYHGGMKKQLTYSGKDHSPVMVRDKGIVVFLRDIAVWSDSIAGPTEVFSIVSVDISSLEERVIFDKKPNETGHIDTEYLTEAGYFTLSNDQEKILFITGGYATNGVLAEVEIDTGIYREFFAAFRFDVIKSGPFENSFLIGVNEIRDEGRAPYYKICDYQGNSLKELSGGYEVYIAYRKNVLGIG